MNLIKDSLDNNDDELREAAQIINHADNIVLSGTGDKYFLCQITQFFSDSFYRKSVRVMHSRILANYTPEWLDKKDVCIFVSESGKTTDVLDAMAAAKKKGSKVILLTGLKHYLKTADLQISVKGGGNSLLAHLNSIFIYALMEEGLQVSSILTVQTIDLPWDLEDLGTNIEMLNWCASTAKRMKQTGVNRLYFLGDGPRFPAASICSRMAPIESHVMRSEGFSQNIYSDDKTMIILLKPRDSQVSTQAMDEYYKLVEEFKPNVVEVDPFMFIAPRGIGTKMDILLIPYYIVVVKALFDVFSKKDSAADSVTQTDAVL